MPDLGPHVLDALDVTLGHDRRGARRRRPTRRGRRDVRPRQRRSSARSPCRRRRPAEPSGLVLELFGPRGVLTLDTAATDARDGGRDIRAAMSTIASEFAAAVRAGRPHPLDVRRGLHLQRLIDDVARQLAR